MRIRGVFRNERAKQTGRKHEKCGQITRARERGRDRVEEREVIGAAGPPVPQFAAQKHNLRTVAPRYQSYCASDRTVPLGHPC